MNIVEEKLKTLPDSPGVYLMKDASGKIIYVGKARVLKNRVRQYFQAGKNHGAKVKAMVAKIAGVDKIPYAETRHYVKRVLHCREKYAKLYGTNCVSPG